jgi:serine/threonine-protein kinase SRPK3
MASGDKQEEQTELGNELGIPYLNFDLMDPR